MHSPPSYNKVSINYLHKNEIFGQLSVEKQFQSLNSATKLDQTHLRHTHNHQVQISEYVEENQQLEESLKSADVLLEMVENVTNSVTGQNQNLKVIFSYRNIFPGFPSPLLWSFSLVFFLGHRTNLIFFISVLPFHPSFIFLCTWNEEDQTSSIGCC
eukprot:TRINITY_DN1788_c0_g2_i26.p1 TRINITY_DN1788_c0_g2~~TRINITY_DN1788_c0_g2_i26.p1  ORF type:complete len:157 (+),score=25.75 TRINITY_DN1788_c0_g2_i26:166-636(+)